MQHQMCPHKYLFSPDQEQTP